MDRGKLMPIFTNLRNKAMSKLNKRFISTTRLIRYRETVFICSLSELL